MSKKAQTPKQAADDIIHIVNLISSGSRDGQYATPAHMKLYSRFKKMVENLAKRTEKAEGQIVRGGSINTLLMLTEPPEHLPGIHTCNAICAANDHRDATPDFYGE